MANINRCRKCDAEYHWCQACPTDDADDDARVNGFCSATCAGVVAPVAVPHPPLKVGDKVQLRFDARVIAIQGNVMLFDGDDLSPYYNVPLSVLPREIAAGKIRVVK